MYQGPSETSNYPVLKIVTNKTYEIIETKPDGRQMFIQNQQKRQ